MTRLGCGVSALLYAAKRIFLRSEAISDPEIIEPEDTHSEVYLSYNFSKFLYSPKWGKIDKDLYLQ